MIRLLLDTITNGKFVLTAPTARNYDLGKSIVYLFVGTGTISTLYKVKKIWGEAAVADFLKYIYEYLNEYAPSDDCIYWLRRSSEDYKNEFSDFMVFLRDVLPPRTWKEGSSDEKECNSDEKEGSSDEND